MRHEEESLFVEFTKIISLRGIIMERYTIKFTGKQRTWLPGCMIRVEIYNIFYDNIDKCFFLQAKYKNLFTKEIKSMWIGVIEYDDAGNKIGESNDILYLDVNAEHLAFFGHKTSIKLTTNSVGNVKIVIQKVAFVDGSTWRNEENKLGFEIPYNSAEVEFGEFYEQYKIEIEKYHLKNECAYAENQYSWVCVCGQGNESQNLECCNCHVNREKLKKISDIEYLRQALEERRKKAEEEGLKKKERNKRNARIAIEGIAIILVLIIAGIFTYKSIIVPNNVYKNAKRLYEAGNYEKAKNIFSSLGSYKDAEKYAEECDIQVLEIANKKKYEVAMRKMQTGDYINAIKEFEALGTYSDSEEQAENVKKIVEYKDGLMKKESGDLKGAIKVFEELGTYSDSEEQVENIKKWSTRMDWKKRSLGILKELSKYLKN